MAFLEMRFLGRVSLQHNSVPLTKVKSQKGVALLCYLAVSGKPATRPFLAALFWPDIPDSKALTNLRKVLSRLKPLHAYLIITRETVTLNPETDVWLDVAEFEAGTAVKQDVLHLQKAISLYDGDFLAGFMLPDTPLFEEWMLAQRARLREIAVTTLYRLVTHFTEEGEYETAVVYARQLLTIEPWHEETHRQLMRLLALLGQRSAALMQYETCRRLLAEELGLEPTAATVQLVQQIKAGEWSKRIEASARSERSRERGDNLPPHNLPPQLTPFVGREPELARLQQLLEQPDIHLITIVGTGGIGKTRLALSCAEQQLGGTQHTATFLFPDGIFLVNLAPLHNTEQLVSTIADALNFPLQGGDGRSPQQQLLDYIRPKQMLLLLDNFEHLIDEVDLLVEILHTAPNIQLLVTSRERLQLRSEQVYPIGGLNFPDWETAPTNDEGERAEEFSAMKLFLQLARRSQPDFALHDKQDLRSLAHICRTVAGMPLALELAASWADMLPLAELATELQQGLNFLETNMRDMPERHRSVRVAIDYSWQKLDEKEQEIFAKLSVFRGGFTREAAKAVAGANLRQLTRLVNKSLVQRGGEKNGRYQLHELLRQYSAEKLAEDGEMETAVRQRHSHFYCTALQKWEADLKSPRQQLTLIAMKADYQNALVAWQEALRQGQLEQLLNAVNGLSEFYNMAERWSEGIALLQESAETVQNDFGNPPHTIPATKLLVWLLVWQVELFTQTPDYYNVEPPDWVFNKMESSSFLLAHPTLVGVDVRAPQAFTHLVWGEILHRVDFARSQEHLAASLELYRSLGDKLRLAEVLDKQGWIALAEHRMAQAQELAEESLKLSQQVGEPRRITLAYIRLGDITRYSLNFDKATALFQKAYEMAGAIDNRQLMTQASDMSAYLAWYLGQFDLALTLFQEKLLWARQAHSPFFEVNCLVQIAVTQIYRGKSDIALTRLEESMQVKPGYVSEWATLRLPMAHLHAGQYEKTESIIRTNNLDGHKKTLSWLKLVQANYIEALAVAQQDVAQQPSGVLEWQTWARVSMGFALYKLGREEEAKQILFDCLQACVAIRAFLPLMHLMPLIPVVLADGADNGGKERTVAVYAMAESLPFVGNSQLFADLTGKTMTAVAKTLPPAVVASAQARGRKLDWWQTAESLLTELTELGWNEPKRE